MGNKNSSSDKTSTAGFSDSQQKSNFTSRISNHTHNLLRNTFIRNKIFEPQSCQPSFIDIRLGRNVEDIFRESDPRMRALQQTQAPAIAPSFSTKAYDIFQNHYLRYRTTTEDQNNFESRCNRNVDALVKARDEEISKIRRDRERLEAGLLTDGEYMRPKSSIESCIDQTDRYSKFSLWDKKYFAPKPERPELSDDMISQIKDASRPEPASEALVEIDGVKILRKDMRTLTNLNWLNDEIMNAYFHLIVKRSHEPGRKKVYAFNTFFYPKLRESGYNSVKRWTRKVDIFSHDYLLVPVHLGNHWCLAFVNFPNRTIAYYDSMGGSTNNCCDTLLDYLRNESNDKKKQDFDDENWRLINSYAEIGIPIQKNCSDCGVFACQFAEYLTRQAELKFTQDHMPYFRRKMIYELLTQRILE